MSDITKERLLAWGAWANNHSDNLGCKSSAAMLMQSAPFADKADLLKPRAMSVFISDDDALLIDRAVGALARHSVLLWAFVRKHYQYGMSVRQLALDHKTSRQKIDGHIERAVGFIDGWLTSNA